MLQIISGKFFTKGERYVHDGKGIAYSNYAWVAPIKTCVATLEPVDTSGAVSSYVICYKNQIEKQEGAFSLVRTGDTEIVEQFRLLCTFGLHAFFDQERDSVAINCRRRPIDASDCYLPCVFVPRFFSPEIRGSFEEVQAFVALVQKVIGLRRSAYRAVIACLNNFSHALQALSHNINLAYSLLVYSLEALSQGFHDFTPTWEDYNDDVRFALDPLLREVDANVAQSIRDALLRAGYLKLQKRFTEFTVKYMEDTFFTDEAPQGIRSIAKSELVRALRNAYYMRSAFAHHLTPIREQLRLVPLAEGDVLHWENEPYLTFAGMVRVAHHAISKFIHRQESLETEKINWHSELPGTVRLEMAPQYWIWRHEGFAPSQAHSKLSGFLSQLETVMLTGGSLTSLGDLLAKYEQLLPNAKPEDQQSMLALYCLFNSLIEAKAKSANFEKVCQEFDDGFGKCTIQMLVTWLIRKVPWRWTASQCADAWKAYATSRFRRNAFRLPPLLEIAVLAEVGKQYQREAHLDEYRKWYDAALLDAAGRRAVQSLIAECRGKQEGLNYDQIVEAAKRSLGKPEKGEQMKE